MFPVRFPRFQEYSGLIEIQGLVNAIAKRSAHANRL